MKVRLPVQRVHLTILLSRRSHEESQRLPSQLDNTSMIGDQDLARTHTSSLCIPSEHIATTSPTLPPGSKRLLTNSFHGHRAFCSRSTPICGRGRASADTLRFRCER